MSNSAASHIPVLSIPKFKALGAYDPALVDVLEPDEDLVSQPNEEDRLQAEFERGRREGEEQTRAHYETLLETAREAHAKSLEEEQIKFDMREAANVSAAIERFLDVMEQRISYSLSRLLQSFLKEQVTEQLVAAFTENLRQLTQDSSEKLIRLRGPKGLVEKVVVQLPALQDRIEVEIADELELIALLDETMIETRFGQWIGQLENLLRETD
ncbi:hypothetical protein ABLO27_06145 [Roseibium sp. SCPC15]|uniref:hypothetical protein n=1 Tax=Roseibium sp. SCP15 TaxID=3141376 RepID=UPI003339C24C